MTVTTICSYEDIISKQSRNIEYVKENQPCYKKIIDCCVLCNNSQIDENDHAKVIGDPTEGALLYMGEELGIDYKLYSSTRLRRDEMPFDSVRKCMTVVVENGDHYDSFTKGAADEMIDKCVSVLTVEHGIIPLTDEKKSEIKS
jgi:Ca2+-transporting ATPase